MSMTRILPTAPYAQTGSSDGRARYLPTFKPPFSTPHSAHRAAMPLRFGGLLRRLSGLALLAALVSAAPGLSAAFASTFLPDPDVSSDEAETGRISKAVIVAKKSTVINVGRAYATALVAEAEIADVVPLSDRSVYILGKKVGATRITVVGKDQRIIQLIEVEVTPDIKDLKSSLRENLPEADIHVSSVNGGLVLSGVVRDAPDVEKAMAVARRYSNSEVTNSLQVAAPQQVMLEVRFVEASRNANRELGVGTRVRGSSVASDTGGMVANTGAVALGAEALLSSAAPFGSLVAQVLKNGTNVDVMIRALEERKLARRLAEPNLITTSGETASFLAGGEFPFPVSAANNQITIEFKQFGVALAFTPTVLSGGLINMKIAPEVSDIDSSTTVEVNGVRIPGLSVRRANTTVELKDGQSLAIAGLLKHTHRADQEQLPWIGQVPVLGTLFRSSMYQKEESDLVIIVTPHLVKPARPGEPLATPLDKPMVGNDVDFFVDGRAEVARNTRRREPKLYGHIITTASDKVTYAPTK